jgi:membrane protease YdiL (CAAX protease family)
MFFAFLRLPVQGGRDMTFSSQVKANDGAGVLVGETPSNHSYSVSSGTSLFVGDHGLRAGWRLVLFLAITVVLLAAFVLIRAGGVHAFAEQQKTASQIIVTPLLMGGSEAIAFLVVCFAALVMAKIERRKFGEYGLPFDRSQSGLWKGGLWGFAAISCTLLGIFLLHGFRITGLALHGTAIASAVAAWGMACLLVGLFEEFLCRGYVQYTLASGIGYWPAALIVSGLFGLVHAFNPNETAVGAVSAGLFGILFCLFLRRGGNLWSAVGFHAAWDFGQTFYGVADSGIRPYHNVFNSVFSGPTWLTGGAVGPEASIMTPIALIVVALIFNHYHRVDRYAIREDCASLAR